MKPHFEDETVTLYHGDCREALRAIPDGSVQTCVSSPPYFGLRSYNGGAAEIGLEQTPQEYVDALVEVFREVRRALRKDGTLWLNLGDTYAANRSYQVTPTKWASLNFGVSNAMKVPEGLKPKDLIGIPWAVAFALRDDGWYLRQDIVWAKKAPMPESVTDRCTRSHEYVFMFAKSERYFYDAQAIAEPATHAGRDDAASGPNAKNVGTGNVTAIGFTKHDTEVGLTRNRRDVWVLGPEPTPFAHFATMPQALAESCILAGTSEKGCCSECGAPWMRMTERTDEADSTAKGSRFDTGKTGVNGMGRVQEGERFRMVTTGWIPSCSCTKDGGPLAAMTYPDPVPCTVLDPFAGSGTTLRVALKHRRRAIGIELNEEYCRMALDRINGVQIGLPLEEMPA